MWNNTDGNEWVAIVIEIDSPRIARAVCENLELVPDWMIPPHPGIHRDSLVIGCTGFADARMGEDAVAAIEPSVRSPNEGMERS